MVFLQSICCATPAFNFCRTSASLFNFILSAPILVRALEPGGRCCVEVILLPCAYLPLLQTYLREGLHGILCLGIPLPLLHCTFLLIPFFFYAIGRSGICLVPPPSACAFLLASIFRNAQRTQKPEKYRPYPFEGPRRVDETRLDVS